MTGATGKMDVCSKALTALISICRPGIQATFCTLKNFHQVRPHQCSTGAGWWRTLSTELGKWCTLQTVFLHFGTQKYQCYLQDYLELQPQTAQFIQNHDISMADDVFSGWKSRFAAPNSGLLVCLGGLGQSWSCCNVWVSELWQILGLRRLSCLVTFFWVEVTRAKGVS